MLSPHVVAIAFLNFIYVFLNLQQSLHHQVWKISNLSIDVPQVCDKNCSPKYQVWKPFGALQ